jgi:hypothetical protein
MKYLIIILTLLSLTTYGQVVKDTTEFNYQDYYQKEYLKSQYEIEKNNLIWGIAGATALGVGNLVNYYRYGEPAYLYVGGGMSLSFNLYSVGRLIYLKKKIKKLE